MRKKVKGIKAKEIQNINKACGGEMFRDNLDTAIDMGKGKGLYTQTAHMVRAIVVDHPFTDCNKRTGYTVAKTMLERNGVVLTTPQKKELAKQVGKIAKKNIGNIKKISKMVEYATK